MPPKHDYSPRNLLTIRDALVDCYEIDDLKPFVAFHLTGLDKRFKTVVNDKKSFDVVCFELVMKAKQLGHLAELVEIVIADCPLNAKAQALKYLVRTDSPPSPSAPLDLRNLFQLPAAIPDFVGREAEIQNMIAALTGGKAVAVAAAKGMGGVGKTSLSVVVAHAIKDHFPDAQIVLDMQGTSDSPLPATRAMANVITAFVPDAKLPDDPNQLAGIYRNVLKDKKALILLDNAKDKAQVEPLLTVCPPVGFLVTSRKAITVSGPMISLNVFEPDEAFRFLREILPKKGTDDELNSLVKATGHLPLALRVAADFLRLRENWTFAKYLAALADETKKWDKLKDDQRSVHAVLSLSRQMLVAESQTLAERWQMLAVFPADFDARAAAAVWQCDEDTALDDLTQLLDRSLIQYDGETDRYDLHDLMKPIARETFGDEAGKVRVAGAELRHSEHYCIILSNAQKLYLNGKENVVAGLKLLDLELMNICHGRNWAIQKPHHALIATYPDCGVYVINLRFSFRELIHWLEDQLAAYRILGDRQGEGNALGNLGYACLATGEVRKVIKYCNQQLEIVREIGDRPGLGNAFGNLGNAWYSIGEVRKGIEYYEQCLSIMCDIGDRLGLGAVLGSLGLAWNSLGEVQTAIGYQEQKLAISKEIGDRQGEGAALCNLGISWKDFGDVRKGIGYFDQSLAIAREIGDRRCEGAALGNLGVAWNELGMYRKGIEYSEEHLIIVREIGDRRGEGNALGNLGIAWKKLGEVWKGISYYEEQLQIVREIEDRLGEGATLWNMALALHSIDQTSEAIAIANQSLVIRDATEDPNAEQVRRKLAEWKSQN